MTQEELEQKGREILSKYSDQQLQDYIAIASVRIVAGEDEDGELVTHRQICQEELERRRNDNIR